MDVLHQGRDVRKRRGVGDGPAIGIKTSLPTGVDIDVVEAVRLQSRGPKCIGLGADIGLRQKTGIDGLLTECAPAEVWPLPNAIHLCAGFLWSNKVAGERESNYERCSKFAFDGYRPNRRIFLAWTLGADEAGAEWHRNLLGSEAGVIDIVRGHDRICCSRHRALRGSLYLDELPLSARIAILGDPASGCQITVMPVCWPISSL